MSPSQSQMMMIAKEILKTPTWAEGRKQTINWTGPWVFSFSWQQASNENQQFFASPKPVVQTQFLMGPISKICVQNVYQTVINCGWNKTQFQPQYQTIPNHEGNCIGIVDLISLSWRLLSPQVVGWICVIQAWGHMVRDASLVRKQMNWEKD